jgi:hypothetical protein
MGMTCTLYRVAASEIGRLRASPAAVEELFFPPASTPPVVEVREKGLTGWILHLIGIKITQVDPNWVPPEGTALDDGNVLDLEGSWHGLHYIFTGTVWEGDPPSCFLVRGGEEIGDDDSDSPPRLLDPNQVRQFSVFLGSVSDEEFTRRFDAERMTALDISPGAIWKPATGDPNPIGLLREGFRDLRTFVATAAERGEAMVIHIS